MYSVKILKDSIGPRFRSGQRKRITTWELTYPRFVHAELMTHRLFSRNSASSRAIPNERLRQRIKDDPAMPVFWGANQSGMQAAVELPFATGVYPLAGDLAKQEWLTARDRMLESSEQLAQIGLHKQLANRLIEPWMHITVIVTATEYGNWFHLRDHDAAQPEIGKASIAGEMHRQYLVSQPEELESGEWHLPMSTMGDVAELIGERRANALGPTVAKALSAYGRMHEVQGKEVLDQIKKIATGRVARVSYLTHDGRRDLTEDVGLHDKLSAGPQQTPPQPGHWSPFEHCAMAMSGEQWNAWAAQELFRAAELGDFFDQTTFGNVIGWKQYRKEFAGEHYRGEK